MGFDAGLVAAATLQRATGLDPTTCSATDATHQLQLAHVLLDGGYDGVATVEEAIAGGDHGLGTFDRLDGEMIVLDVSHRRALNKLARNILAITLPWKLALYFNPSFVDKFHE